MLADFTPSVIPTRLEAGHALDRVGRVGGVGVGPGVGVHAIAEGIVLHDTGCVVNSHIPVPHKIQKHWDSPPPMNTKAR